MAFCELCGEVVDRVHRCVDCGTKFFKDCGDPDPKKQVCALCSAYKALEGATWEDENIPGPDSRVDNVFQTRLVGFEGEN